MTVPIELNTEILTLFTAYAFRSKQIMSQFIMKVNPETDFYGHEFTLALLWAVLKQWSTACAGAYSPVPEAIARALLGSLIAKYGDALDQGAIQSANGLLDTVYQISGVETADTGARTLITDIGETFLAQRRATAALQGVNISGKADLFALRDEFSKLSSEVSSPEINEFDLFADTPDEDLAHRIPIQGCNWLNLWMGGGIGAGDVFGILGSPGGGKTATALHVGLRAAMDTLNPRNVMYLCYEAKPHPDYRRRLFSYLGGIPYGDLSTIGSAKELKQKFPEAYTRIDRAYHSLGLKDRFRLVDMVGNADGSEGLVSIINQYQDREQWKPDIVIVDQYYYMLQNYLHNLNGKVDDRKVSQGLLTRIVAAAAEEQVAIGLLHQVTAAAKGRPATVRPRQGEYAEDKAFDAWIQYTLILGTHGPAHVMWAKPVKARGADPALEFKLYLDGAYARVWDVTDMYDALPGEDDFTLSALATTKKVRHQRQAARAQLVKNSEESYIEFPWDPNEPPPTADDLRGGTVEMDMSAVQASM